MKEKGGKTGTGPTDGQDDKARRLAEALRANLRRRKAQSRARATDAKPRDKEETPGGDSR